MIFIELLPLFVCLLWPGIIQVNGQDKTPLKAPILKYTATAKSIHLTWDIDTAEEKEIFGYKIFYKKESDDAENFVSVDKKSQHTLADLEECTKYEISIMTVADQNSKTKKDSPKGGPITAETIPDPVPVKSVSVDTSKKPNMVTVVDDKNNGNLACVDFQYKYQIFEKGSTDSVENIEQKDKSLNLDNYNLAVNKYYTVKVTVIDIKNKKDSKAVDSMEFSLGDNSTTKPDSKNSAPITVMSVTHLVSLIPMRLLVPVLWMH